MLAKRLDTVLGTSDILTGAIATVRVHHAGPVTRDDAQQLRDALNTEYAIDVAVTAFVDAIVAPGLSPGLQPIRGLPAPRRRTANDKPGASVSWW
jgi:hypothetical protein